MTKHEELERAVERLEADLLYADSGEEALATIRTPDLRLILSANREMREQVEALTEALTPSGDTKAAYHGNFKFQVTQWREIGDVGCEEEWEEYLADFAVPWTTVKEIMAAIKARSALTTQRGDGE